MIGVVVTDASDELVSKAVLSVVGTVFSSWSTYRLSELVESLPPEVSDEISVDEFELPFLMVDREASVRVSIAKAESDRAVEFLIGTARELLAAPDLDVCALKEFRRQEYMGRQVDLEWYLEKLEAIVGLAEWTIWTGLPDPMEAGHKQLLLAANEGMLELIASRIRSAASSLMSSGRNPTSTGKEGSIVGIDFVDVEKELSCVISRYRG